MLISIAGNIGAGKSSVTSLLHEHFGWKPLSEPVLDNPYIEDFYSDMKKWAYQSQLYFLSRHCIAKDQIPQGNQIAVQDRSVYEDGEIFTSYLFDLGYIDSRDYTTYAAFYNGLLEVLPPPTILIYLRADTDSLMGNIQKRGREYERALPRTYIDDLNRRYDTWASTFNKCPLHIIEAGALEYLQDTQAQEELLYTIKQLAH